MQDLGICSVPAGVSFFTRVFFQVALDDTLCRNRFELVEQTILVKLPGGNANPSDDALLSLCTSGNPSNVATVYMIPLPFTFAV